MPGDGVLGHDEGDVRNALVLDKAAEDLCKGGCDDRDRRDSSFLNVELVNYQP